MRYNAYPYQERATQWLLDKPHSLLALDMGLGKSVITLTAIRALIDDCEIEKALVVAPKKVAETTWTSEAGKWDHLRSLRVVKVLGTERQRLEALAGDADVYVTGRDNYAWLVAHYQGEMPFDMLVIDELTSFKSRTSIRFKAMKASRPSFSRITGLTGTPTPNGLIDLWGQMYCIDGGERLGTSLTAYRQKYFSTYKRNFVTLRTTVMPGKEDEIKGLIADITLTMQARDYLELPEMLTHTELVTFSPKVAKGYRDFEREKVLAFAQEAEGKPAQIVANSAAGLMNKLAQYSNGAVYDDERVPREVHGEKLDRLAEIVESAGSPVLVFYQFKHDVPRIKARLAEKGRVIKTYEGERQLEEWNAGRIDVLLAHPASTAYGLNMQHGGHYIVWYGLGWDLELYQQANARLHRQGQKYPVMVYRLLGAGTVDERAASALDGKQTRQQSLLDALSALVKEYTDGSNKRP